MLLPSRFAVALFACGALAPSAVLASTPLLGVDGAPDTTVVLGGETLTDEHFRRPYEMRNLYLSR